jgi:predicted GTPase
MKRKKINPKKTTRPTVERALIMGAAGRDFHNFNTHFRNNAQKHVVCFTAAQIPDIAGRKYPPTLSGKGYPSGIPIYPELQLTGLIKKNKIDTVYLSYSDLSHEEVMHKASITIAAGANFELLGTDATYIKSTKPVISICAVRTGSGKSQTSRHVADYFRKRGKKVVAIRHPMPYGDLEKQSVQRFATYQDLEKHKCTIEEREEYEPHIAKGVVVYAGVDYEKILRAAEKEADIIIWDGGNNDLPFYRPDLHIVIADPHRAGHEISYHPGEANLRMADVIIINKVDSAQKKDIDTVKRNIKQANPRATVIEAESPISAEQNSTIKGKTAIVVEDGPTLTHGGMTYGAGMIAAKKYGAKVIDAQKYSVGTIKQVYAQYSRLKIILPAMGYGKKQVEDLQKTINNAQCEIVMDGSPIDLAKLIKVNKPVLRIRYDFKEVGTPKLDKILSRFI